MPLITRTDAQLIRHPLDFARVTLRHFSDNQGLMLAGAIAYYALLSLVPMIILAVLGLSHWVDPAELLATLQRYLEWLVPSQAAAVLADVSGFVDRGASLGIVLIATLLFFSSLTFSILQKAMARIFAHRHVSKKRHPVIAALLPFSLVLLFGVVLLAITVASLVIQSLATESLTLFGRDWPLQRYSGGALYGLGLASEVAILTLLYSVLPGGRTRVRHAFVGALVITALWDGVRHALLWYLATLSNASIVYGSLTSAVVLLFSFELAATLLLLGAQVISEYEQLAGKLGDAGDAS